MAWKIHPEQAKEVLHPPGPGGRGKISLKMVIGNQHTSIHPAGAAKRNMNIFGHVSMCFEASRIMSARQITQSWVQKISSWEVYK